MTNNLRSICDYIISKGNECGDPVNHLKLQKILFISYGWYLTKHNKKLFDDKIEASEFGIIINSVYNKYIDYSYKQITNLESKIQPISEICKFIDSVWSMYGKYSSFTLTNYTHVKNSPFNIIKNSFGGYVPKNFIVEDGLIREFFLREQERIGKEELNKMISQ